MKPIAWLWLVVAMMLTMSALCPPQTLAQVPARFYWKTLSDASAVPMMICEYSYGPGRGSYISSRSKTMALPCVGSPVTDVTSTSLKPPGDHGEANLFTFLPKSQFFSVGSISGRPTSRLGGCKTEADKGTSPSPTEESD
jgi:hypothetical protein